MTLTILFTLVMVWTALLLLLQTPKPHYFWGKTKHWWSDPEPFIEVDEDGFITDESYKSHIKISGRGKMSIPPGIIMRTRAFKEQCDGIKEIFENQNKINR